MKRRKLAWKIRTLLYRIVGKRFTALASFPRSGNTWVRAVIEQATGVQTGSIYKDEIMQRGKRGIVIKTHVLDSERYTHAVHIIRNPFDAIDSYFDYQVLIAGNKKLTWDEHVRFAVGYWRSHTEHWTKVRYPLYRVRYEDLHEHPEHEFQMMLKWLGYDLSKDEITKAVNECSLQKLRDRNPDVGQQFFRRGTVGSGRQRFSAKETQFVTAELHDLMAQFGYS